jgi:hypothetical protein
MNYLINSFRFAPQITCASPLISTTDLRAYYNLNGDANDTSGGGYNGTATNADILSGIVGKFDGGAYFPVSNTNRAINISSNFGSLLPALSFSFWFKNGEFLFGNPLLGFRSTDNNNYRGINIFIRPSGLIIRFGNGGGTGAGNRRDYTISFTIDEDEWYHCVVVVNSGSITTTSVVSAYLNGVLGTTVYSSGTATSVVYGTGSSIGKLYNSTSYGADLTVDDLSIWNKVLSQTEVDDLYNVNCPLI